MTQYEKGFEDCKKQVKAAMVAAIEEAILMEREACARLVDDYSFIEGKYAARQIRARWQK
jgi:hypothetical protein